jgi:hypothetical protein
MTVLTTSYISGKSLTNRENGSCRPSVVISMTPSRPSLGKHIMDGVKPKREVLPENMLEFAALCGLNKNALSAKLAFPLGAQHDLKNWFRGYKAGQ